MVRNHAIVINKKMSKGLTFDKRNLIHMSLNSISKPFLAFFFFFPPPATQFRSFVTLKWKAPETASYEYFLKDL